MKKMKKLLCMALVLLLVLSAVACTAKVPVEDTQTSSNGTNETNTQAAASSTGDMTLRVTCPTTPETCDPARGTGENDRLLYVNAYECLVKPNEKDGSPEPALAESWEAADDGLTYTFKLRSDVCFADGTAMTAEDVKYSLDRMIALGQGYAYILSDVLESTEAADEHTVVFHLKKCFGPFVSSMTCFRILNSKLMKENTVSDGSYGENGDYGTTFLLTNTAGSGPYYVSSFTVHDNYVLTQNENYWGTIPEKAPKSVTVTELTESSTTKMLMSSGELDMVHGHQDTSTVKALEANGNLKAVLLPDSGLNFFMLNTKKAPTDDVHIRKALAYATNYEQMQQILGGAPVANGPVPTGLYGYADSFEGYTYNVEKAKEEIAQSGYADTLANYPIQMDYIEGNGDTGKLVYLLASELENLGFKVQINEVPWVQFCNNEAEIATSPNVTNLFCTANYPEAGAILEYKYASWTTGNWNQNEWLQDEKFDSMITEALATVDDDARLKLYSDMQAYITDDLCASIFTCGSVVMPVYNMDRFSWRGTTDTLHTCLEYNFCYAEYEMK